MPKSQYVFMSPPQDEEELLSLLRRKNLSDDKGSQRKTPIPPKNVKDLTRTKQRVDNYAEVVKLTE